MKANKNNIIITIISMFQIIEEKNVVDRLKKKEFEQRVGIHRKNSMKILEQKKI